MDSSNTIIRLMSMATAPPGLALSFVGRVVRIAGTQPAMPKIMAVIYSRLRVPEAYRLFRFNKPDAPNMVLSVSDIRERVSHLNMVHPIMIINSAVI